MKKTLLPLLAAVFFFGSCKKDDDKKDFIQLQKIEGAEDGYNFQYNEQHQLTRFEVLRSLQEGAAPVLYRYAIISYENNIPVSADLYNMKEDRSSFYVNTKATLHYNGQNKIAFTVAKYYSESGTYYEGDNDTVNYTFNTDNRLISVKHRGESEPWAFTYDAQGNIKFNDRTYQNGNYTDKVVYDLKYDNGINPFNVNGLGLTLFALYQDNDFDLNQMLSANNPTYGKIVYTYTDNVNSNVDKYTDLYQYTNSYDENGGLKEVSYTYDWTHELNGEPRDHEGNQGSVKVTCVKKQY